MKKQYIISTLYLTLFVFFLLSPSFAERKTFTFSADSTSANLAKGKEFTVLRGNAEVIADDVKINAGEIKLYGDDFQFAEVLGRFTAYDQKNDFVLEGNSLLYDRQKKLLRAEGNILMKDNQNDVVIRASFLESKEDGKLMVVQLGIRITQKDELSARSEFLTYYRETEELEMMGFPFVLWKEDKYRAQRVSINLDTDEVRLEGEVNGAISTEQEGDDESDIDENTDSNVDESSGDNESPADNEINNEQEDANGNKLDTSESGTSENEQGESDESENGQSENTVENSNVGNNESPKNSIADESSPVQSDENIQNTGDESSSENSSENNTEAISPQSNVIGDDVDTSQPEEPQLNIPANKE